MDKPLFMIVSGNAENVLRRLPDRSVQCCVTSPPYYNLRDYGEAQQIGLEETVDQYIERLVAVFAQVHRILKDDGTLWLNIGDSYARSGGWADNAGLDGLPRGQSGRAKTNQQSGRNGQRIPSGLKSKDLIGVPWKLAFALRDAGWYLRQDIIWAKPNPLPESVKDRCTRSHEYMFLLTKRDRYYYDHESIKEPLIRPEEFSRKTPAVFGGRNKNGSIPSRLHSGNEYINQLNGKNKRDVWFVAPQSYKGAHFAVFPPKLIEPCVLAGSKPGSIILDPFSGAGTTGLVALGLGRRFFGVDISAEYCDLARARILDGVAATVS